jgi:sec-independent protein translocase protein TatC
VAVTAPRRRGRKNPDGRMPLAEHFRELRRRVIISVAAIALGSVAGWFLYEPVWHELQEPLHEIAAERDQDAQVNFQSLTSAFNLHVKLAAYLGLILACPVWLYQIWAFITPGLTRKERRTSVGFVAVAVPMFLGGIALAWWILPHAVKVLTDFTPEGASNIVSADEYLTFTTRLLLAFGIAFVVPLLLVALNMVGILSGATLGKQWRISVFIIFLFTAIASPSPDVGSLMLMALPLVGLYVITVGICLLNDRRRRRKRGDDAVFGLADDEASPLADDPEPLRGADDLAGGAVGVTHTADIGRPAPLDRSYDDDAT